MNTIHWHHNKVSGVRSAQSWPSHTHSQDWFYFQAEAQRWRQTWWSRPSHQRRSCRPSQLQSGVKALWSCWCPSQGGWREPGAGFQTECWQSGLERVGRQWAPWAWCIMSSRSQGWTSSWVRNKHIREDRSRQTKEAGSCKFNSFFIVSLTILDPVIYTGNFGDKKRNVRLLHRSNSTLAMVSSSSTTSRKSVRL